MAKKSQVPAFVRLGNMFMFTLLRAGFKMVGPGKYPIYLLTVRGRKSGQPRTFPLVIIERNGKRYLAAVYGVADWARNLRAAGQAVLTRGRRTETVSSHELPLSEAALVLRDEIKGGHPFASYFGVTDQSPLEDFEKAVAGHPIFLLENRGGKA